MGFAKMVEDELIRARGAHKPLSSSHEAFAVIKEELDEFWEQVRLKRADRDRPAMLKELIQIGAMAQRAAEDLGLLLNHATALEAACGACEGAGRFTSPHGASVDCPHCGGSGKPKW